MRLLKIALLLAAAAAGLWTGGVAATHTISWQDGYFFNAKMPYQPSTLCVEGDTDIATAIWIKDLINSPQGWAPVGYSLVWPSSNLGQGAEMGVRVTGYGGIPATGVGAVALALTATEPSAGTFLSVYPTGILRPNTSNLNLAAGQTMASFVTSKVGDDGGIVVYNEVGTVHVIIDVFGWFDKEGNYHPLPPVRILDTRGAAPVCDVTVTFDHLGSTWWAAQVMFQEIEKVDRGGPAYAVHKFVVQVNVDQWPKYSAWSKQLIINHEFGHVVGPLADHDNNDDCSLLMSYCWITNVPSQAEILAVRSMYGLGLAAWIETAKTDIWRGVVTGAATAIGAALMFGLGGLVWKRLRK